MNKRIFNMCFAAILFAIGYVLPFLTGQIPEIGNMFCPMHLPVLICGFICGWKYGLIVGLVLPIFRSLTLSMPPLYPAAFAMSFEMGIYGLVTGLLNKNKDNLFSLILSLLLAMLSGRIMWGLAMWIIALTSNIVEFSFSIFIAGAFLTAWPGIISHLLIVPTTILTYRKLENK